MARRNNNEHTEVNVEETLEQILEAKLDESSENIEELVKDSKPSVEELKEKISNATDYFENNHNETTCETIDNADNSVFFKHLKPANDIKSTHTIFNSIQPKYSRFYLITTALSTVWTAGSIALGYHLTINNNQNLQSFLTSSNGWFVISSTILPVLGFWGFSKLSNGMKDLISLIRSLDNNAKLNQADPMQKVKENILDDVEIIDNSIQKSYERAWELEAIVRNEVQNLETAYSENEERIRKLVNMLSNERQAIIEHADRVKNSLRITRSEISEELSSVTDNITLNIETIAERLSNSLNEKTQHMLDNLQAINGSLSGDLISEIEKNSSTYLIQLNDIFSKIKSEINDKSNDSINAFSQKIDVLDNTANNFADGFRKKFDDIDQLLSTKSEESLTKFNTQIDNFTNIFNAIPSRLNIVTEKAFEEFKKNLEALDDVLSNESKSAISSFITYSISVEENTDKLSNLLNNRVDEINSSLKTRIQELSQVFDDSKQNLITVVESTQSNMRSQIGELETKMSELLNNKNQIIKDSFVKNNEIISQIINEENSKATLVIKEQVESIYHQLSAIEQDLTNKLSDLNGNSDKYLEILDQHSNSIVNQLENKLATLVTAIDNYNENIISKTLDAQDSIDTKLTDTLAEQAKKIDERLSRIKDIINEQNASLDDTLQGSASKYEDNIKNISSKIHTSFDQHLGTLHNYTSELNAAINRTKSLHDELNEQHVHIGEFIDSKSEQIKSVIDDTVKTSINNLYSNVQEVSENIKSEISQAAYILTDEAKVASQYIEDINDKLHGSVAQLEETFSSTQQNVMQGAEVLAQNMHAKLSTIQKQIGTEADTATKKLIETAETISSTLSEVSLEMEKNLTARSSILNETAMNVSTNIGIHLSQIEDTLTQISSHNDTYLQEQIDELNKTSKNLVQAAARTTEVFNAASMNLNKKIEDTSALVQDKFAFENKLLLDAIAQRSNQISETLYKYNDDLFKAMDSILQQINLSSDSIFNKTEEIVNNIHRSEVSLHSAADKIKQASLDINKDISASNTLLSENMHTFKEITQGTKFQLEDLKHNFTQHANLLRTASALLGKSQTHFDTTIEERTKTLSKLTTAMDSKSAELSESIKKYQDMISKSLISNRLQTKASLAELSEDMKGALNEAINKFQNASNILRRQAKEISTELNTAMKSSVNREEKLALSLEKGNNSMKVAMANQAQSLSELASVMHKAQQQTVRVANGGSIPRIVSQPPRNTTKEFTLNEIAKEIVNEINKNELASMWAGYNKNQTNISEESLYTKRGITLLKEIQKQYAINKKFHNNAEQFMKQFEKILKHISDAKQPNGVFNALQTNNGKIYTMLAHAAGKIK